MIAGSIAFVAMGIWLWSIADQQTRRDPVIVKIVSGACIVFFGLAGIVGISMLFNKKPGVIIDDRGISIFSLFTEVTFVPWATITGIGEVAIHRTKLIMVFINNVDEFIAARKPLVQKTMRYSVNAYGTPISISTNTLNVSHKEMIAILEKAIKTHATDQPKDQL